MPHKPGDSPYKLPEDVTQAELDTGLAAKQDLAQKGSPDGYVGLDSGSLAIQDQLGTGTADATTFLRGDQTWAVPGGGGSATITQVSIDFGSTATRDKSFVVVDAAVAATDKIIVVQAGQEETEENGGMMDALSLTALPGTGQFTLTASSRDMVRGVFKVNYMRAA